jgi:hypothetical protein
LRETKTVRVVCVCVCVCVGVRVRVRERREGVGNVTHLPIVTLSVDPVVMTTFDVNISAPCEYVRGTATPLRVAVALTALNGRSRIMSSIVP